MHLFHQHLIECLLTDQLWSISGASIISSGPASPGGGVGQFWQQWWPWLWQAAAAITRMFPPRSVNYYQKWALQPGDSLAGYQIHSGLGDISIQLEGKTLFYALRWQSAAPRLRRKTCA